MEVTAAMETEWRIARGQLRELLQENAKARHQDLADQLGYSVGWVRKWRKRLANSDSQDERVLRCQSHRPKQVVQHVTPQLEIRILELRGSLSEQYHRTVGPRTIAAYLRREADQWEGVVPTSSATIWRILRRHHAILTPMPVGKHPVERPAPGLHWEIDFCTAAAVSPDAPDKHQHGLEIFNVVDRGSSAVIDSQPSALFDAEFALQSMVRTLQQQGVPLSITYDRDPRFVGSQATDGFPSAFTRFLLCVGCDITILPPRRPDLKPFVERFQRTLKQECLYKHRPTTAVDAQAQLLPYCQWYNQARPHQGRDNHDQPPQHRLTEQPALALLPETVDPEAWLSHYHNHRYRRHVNSQGAMQLWKSTYYVGKAYRNQTVSVRLDAPQRAIHLELGNTLIKTIPLKNLHGAPVDFQTFLGFMCDEARSEWKNMLWRQRHNSAAKR